MTPDKFNVYTNTNGSKYFIQPDQSVVNLSYYNPTNGDYAEAGDDTVYDVNGSDTGNVFNGAALVSSAGGTSKTSWLDILNTGLGVAGSIINKNNTATTSQYTPIQPAAAPAKSTGTVWKVVGVLAAIGVVVLVVVKSKKGKGAAGK